MQDDALFPLLTVRETLLYSARLKLRGSMTYKEKEERVELVIQQMGLSLCGNTKVGNDVVSSSLDPSMSAFSALDCPTYTPVTLATNLALD